jgi:hypothetical protein
VEEVEEKMFRMNSMRSGDQQAVETDGFSGMKMTRVTHIEGGEVAMP